MFVKDSLLFNDGESQIQYSHTDNSWPKLNPLYLIIHYTANQSVEETINHFQTRRPSGNASAHIIIGRDGEVVQMVKFNRRAWHAGRSKWGELEGMNNFSIGIELVNSGWVTETEAGNWVDWRGRVTPPEEVIVAPHRNDPNQIQYGWQTFTEPQINSLIEVSIALDDRYSFLDIMGHDDISPIRKVDPGPAFNMISFRSLILGRTENR